LYFIVIFFIHQKRGTARVRGDRVKMLYEKRRIENNTKIICPKYEGKYLVGGPPSTQWHVVYARVRVL